MQVQLEKTLNVEVVERHLAELWKQTSGSVDAEDDFAVLRARVANLLVYAANESSLKEVNEVVAELTAIHPSRVLLMLGENQALDRDIEMSLETFCQTDDRGPQRASPVGVVERTGAKRLCCEEITLKAAGNFVSELPSAALPLTVPDLTTFLWWRAALVSSQASDRVFDALLRASDRLIVDSAEFVDPQSDLLALANLFHRQDYAHVGISDLNWARLTSWRALLAGFYDVPAYQPFFNRIDRVRIEYIASKSGPDACAPSPTVAPQALLIAGWLASRLGWNLLQDQPPAANDQVSIFKLTSDPVSRGKTEQSLPAHYIQLELNRVERAEGKAGRLVLVELQSNTSQPASFTVSRSTDNLHLSTEARVNAEVQRGRVVPVRNRTSAQLLGREMEILCNDQIYQEGLAMAARMITISRATR